MLMVSASIKWPSLTRAVAVYVPGPCASVGVQVNAPPGVRLPTDPAASVKVSGCVGIRD